jgi:hypothetical protein
MNTRWLNLIVLPVAAMQASCGRQPTQGKWVDYGNGIVNLANVTHIDPQAGLRLGMKINMVKFDKFELSFGTDGVGVNMSTDDFDKLPEEKKNKILEEADKKLKEINSRKMDTIRDFLKSDSTYMHL